jgi:hypothetical protein
MVVNITDTASNVESGFVNYQIGGTSRVRIRKDGAIVFANTAAASFAKQTATNLIEAATGWSVAAGGINGVLMQSALFSVGSNGRYGFGTTGPTSGIDASFIRIAAGIIGVRNATTGGGVLSFVEQSAPAAPATNEVRIYAEDNGSGKTRLMALFATGAAQQIAIEP